MAAARATAVRPATPDDADAIASVHVRSWQAAYRGIVPDAMLDALSIQRGPAGGAASSPR
jgi:hypothetical protein